MDCILSLIDAGLHVLCIWLSEPRSLNYDQVYVIHKHTSHVICLICVMHKALHKVSLAWTNPFLFIPPHDTKPWTWTHFYIMIRTFSDYQIIRKCLAWNLKVNNALERLKCRPTYFAFIWEKSVQGTCPFKVVFQGFSRHLQIQGRFKAFQGFKVVAATLLTMLVQKYCRQ